MFLIVSLSELLLGFLHVQVCVHLSELLEILHIQYVLLFLYMYVWMHVCMHLFLCVPLRASCC